MTDYWWQDALDRDGKWQGLELRIQPDGAGAAVMEMVSGHHGRMALLLGGQPLFWASMLENHSGVWLIMNTEHQSHRALLAPISSMDVESCERDSIDRTQWWCRYFSRSLAQHAALLPAGRWLLSPMTLHSPGTPGKKSPPPSQDEWRFDVPAHASSYSIDWTLYGEHFPDLTALQSVTLVDWWWGGNLLLGRYPIDPDAGRLKWWRKKSREGTLPPILVWHVAGLASFIILDGHYRLQAAMEEGIAPDFLVLSEIATREYTPDSEAVQRKLDAIARQQRKNPHLKPDAFNQLLIELYDTRYEYALTRSRALLGDGEQWAQDVSSYLRRHQLEHYLEPILARIEPSSGE